VSNPPKKAKKQNDSRREFSHSPLQGGLGGGRPPLGGLGGAGGWGAVFPTPIRKAQKRQIYLVARKATACLYKLSKRSISDAQFTKSELIQFSISRMLWWFVINALRSLQIGS
ncbi:MAG: hypothetical protein RIR12_2563, partial [Bacteroidota bacterium]